MMRESKRRRTMASSATGASPISDLPNHLVHSIFTCLPPQTASKLCILSKRFYSAWNSAPSLSFHLSTKAKRNQFIDYIHSTLARRAPGLTLDQFRIQAPALALAASADAPYHDHRVDAAIDHVLSRGVRVLDLDLGAGGKCRRYLFPPRILTAANNASLNALRLSGFELDPADPVLHVDYPLLADLTLSRTSGITKLEISCPKLKSLDIASCFGLQYLTLDSRTSNLESFSFVGTRGNEHEPHDLRISAACPSLTRVSVSNVLIPGEWAADVAARQRGLESLRLTKFEAQGGALDLFDHDNLRLVELEIWSKWVVGIRIRAPNLETLKVSYKDELYSGEFDISGCGGSLETLELSRVWITGEWMEANMPNFERLKCLELRHCSDLTGMKVHHQGLERLVLDGCNELDEMEIVASSLGEFKHRFSSLVPGEAALGASGRLLATLGLPSGMFYEGARFARSCEFLKSFGQCRQLTLLTSSLQDLIIDARLREGKTAPMYDLRRLEVEVVKYDKVSGGGIVALLDSLLWLAPRVNVLSLLFSNKRRILKLNYYAQRDPKDKDQLPCCERWWPIKCWRHTLRAVTMENFEPTEKVDLVEFFRWSTAKLEAVYDNAGTIFAARAD